MMMRTSSSIRAAILILLPLTAVKAQTATPKIVTAAKAFVSTLDDKQKERFLFAFDDDKQRVRWSNFPVRMTPRAGLSMGELSAAQRSAAMALVASVLSRRGLEKVQEIIDGDEVLKSN